MRWSCWCADRSVLQVQAYSPLVKAKKLKNRTLLGIAQELDRTSAQVLIRWSLQKGFVPLPKSVNKERIRTNVNVLDFELSPAQMERLDALECDYVTAWDPTRTDPV